MVGNGHPFSGAGKLLIFYGVRKLLPAAAFPAGLPVSKGQCHQNRGAGLGENHVAIGDDRRRAGGVLHALRYQQFSIGEAVFQANALCHPCFHTHMEQALGKGGVAAMLGHGGLCCRILRSGEIAIGDAVKVMVKGQTRELVEQ